MSLFQSMDAQEVKFWQEYLEVTETLEAVANARRAGLLQTEDFYEEDRLCQRADELHVQLWSSKRTPTVLPETPQTA